MPVALLRIRERSWWPLGVGVLALLVSLWHLGKPSYWYDEMATVSATNRPLPEMNRLLHHVDAVHGAYYYVMHFWFDATRDWGSFGLSREAARLPSAIAVAAAAGLMVVLGTKLLSTRFGVIAGLGTITIPRVLWAAGEARGYSFSILFAVLAMLALLVALERGRTWWLLYAATMFVSGAWFLLSISLLGAHAVVVISRRGVRRSWPFCVAAGLTGAALLPFAWFVHGQAAQISWIAPFSGRTIRDYLHLEFFEGAPAYAVVAAIIVVIGIGLTLWKRWARRRSADAEAEAGPVVVVALAWLGIPAIIVLGYSWLGTSTYVPRYLAFTAPALALLIAVGIDQLAELHRSALLLVVVLAGLATPAYLAQRTAYGHTGGSDFSAAADYIRSHARAGDCVAFESRVSWSPASDRAILLAAPTDFRGLDDIGPAVPAGGAGTLWDTDRPIDDYGLWARKCTTVWVITDGDRGRRTVIRPSGGVNWYFDPFHFTDSELYRALASSGLRIESTTRFNHSQVVRLGRPTGP
jgi:mannosyltransferase